MSDTDFEIEDSVAFSSNRNTGMTSKIISTMEKLQVGQSFLVPGDSKLGSSAIQAYYRSAGGYTNPRPEKGSTQPIRTVLGACIVARMRTTPGSVCGVCRMASAPSAPLL